MSDTFSTDCNAIDTANTAYESLVQGIEFPESLIDLTESKFNINPSSSDPVYQSIEPSTIDTLTTTIPGGTGIMEVLLKTLMNHLTDEFDKGRLSQDSLVEIYNSNIPTIMQLSLQYDLTKGLNHWQTISAQEAAKAAQYKTAQAAAELEVLKLQVINNKFQAENSKAIFANNKLQVAIKSEEYCKMKIEKQHAEFTLNNLLPQQEDLLKEQVETQRAQTLDTRTDDITPIGGVLGKQTKLYATQTDTYIKDAQYKVGKLFADSWTIQKGVDSGLAAPSELQNNTINAVLHTLRVNNSLD